MDVCIYIYIYIYMDTHTYLLLTPFLTPFVPFWKPSRVSVMERREGHECVLHIKYTRHILISLL